MDVKKKEIIYKIIYNFFMSPKKYLSDNSFIITNHDNISSPYDAFLNFCNFFRKSDTGCALYKYIF